VTFIESYEHDLVDAAERRYRRRSRRFVSRHGRGLAVALAALTVSGSAATAAVTGWDPLDDPDRNPRVGRPTETSRPVDPALVAQLAVLRRPQNETDRRDITGDRLRGLGRSFRGVRIDGIRLLDPDRGVVLVPVEGMPVPRDPQGRPLPGFDDARNRNTVCVAQPNRDGFESVSCHNSDKIASGLAIGSSGGYVDGLVPDGVARVRLIRGDRTTAEAPVRNNYFYVESAFPNAVEWLGPDGSLVKRTELR
jgi:hypothetical protein